MKTLSLSALIVLLGDKKCVSAIKKPVPVICKGSILETQPQAWSNSRKESHLMEN